MSQEETDLLLGRAPTHRHTDSEASTNRLYDPRTGPLKILVWNIQFAASTSCHFFYEGGPLTSVPHRSTVGETLDEIAALIARHDPDVVLLQEVDRCSRRSWYIDEHTELLRRLPCYVYEASTWYWQMPWIPAPLGLGKEMLGRVDLHLSVLSKYALRDVRRVPLPAIKSDGCIARLFNLRRCVQLVTLPTADGLDVNILHTHLSAFTNGDGTAEAQVSVCATPIPTRNAGCASRLVLCSVLLPVPPLPMRNRWRCFSLS